MLQQFFKTIDKKDHLVCNITLIFQAQARFLQSQADPHNHHHLYPGPPIPGLAADGNGGGAPTAISGGRCKRQVGLLQRRKLK